MTEQAILLANGATVKTATSNDEWNVFLEKLAENKKDVDAELEKLYTFISAEEVDNVHLRVSKIKTLNKILKTLHNSIESCEWVLTHVALTESQKCIIDEYIRIYEEKLVWWANISK